MPINTWRAMSFLVCSRVIILARKGLLGHHTVRNIRTFEPGGRRHIHLSATYNVVEDVFETSSKIKWAEDAVANPGVPETAGDLASLGLGGYSPVGMLQHAINFLHNSVGLPWWASIAVSTIILRLSIVPVVVKLQANAIRMNNIRPEIDKHMTKIKQLQQKGEQEFVNYESAKLMALYNEHNCNPIKTAIMPLLQVCLVDHTHHFLPSGCGMLSVFSQGCNRVITLVACYHGNPSGTQKSCCQGNTMQCMSQSQ